MRCLSIRLRPLSTKPLKDLKDFKKNEEAMYAAAEKLARENPWHPFHAILKDFGSYRNYVDCKMAAQAAIDRLWNERKI